MQQQYNHIVVSLSGGKDSSVLMWYAINNFPKEKIIAVHAQIDIDWEETLPTVEKQCEFFGIPLVTVQAAKGFLEQLTSKRKDRKTGKLKETKFPSADRRWCTSDLKKNPIDKFLRTFRGNILLLIGERREESNRRAKLEEIRPDTRNSNSRRTITIYSPLLNYLEKDIWDIINTNNIPVHPCYSLGISRASCCICIFSSNEEIAIAARHAPDIVQKYIEAEQQISHKFRYKAATKRKPEIKLSIEEILNPPSGRVISKSRV